ncbi:unnamed protein product, partial [Ectocarpus sp. 6 AP-2014]
DALLRTEQGKRAALEKEVKRLKESTATLTQRLLDAVAKAERADEEERDAATAKAVAEREEVEAAVAARFRFGKANERRNHRWWHRIGTTDKRPHHRQWQRQRQQPAGIIPACCKYLWRFLAAVFCDRYTRPLSGGFAPGIRWRQVEATVLC